MMDYGHVQHGSRLKQVLTTAIAFVVGFTGGVIILLLGLRLALSYIPINNLPSFTSTVFNYSYPFIAPVGAVFGQMAVHYQTILAIGFWAILAWAIVRICKALKYS